MTEPPIAIQALRLAKVLGHRTVLKDVDFEIATGQRVALVGGNGAGKTTLLRCLASITRPSAGEVRWFGRPSRGDANARRLLGLVAHDSLLYPHLTLRENLVFSARMCDVDEPQRRADELLQSTGLEPHGHRLPATISRGMRQRLSIARALVHHPRILLLDEPFAGLDAEATQWLTELLMGLGDVGRTVCFTAHDSATVARLADRILAVRSSRVYEAQPDTSTTTADCRGPWRRAA